MAASGFGLPASRLQGVEPSCQTVGLCNILVLMLTLVFDIRVVFQGEFRPHGRSRLQRKRRKVPGFIRGEYVKWTLARPCATSCRGWTRRNDGNTD